MFERNLGTASERRPHSTFRRNLSRLSLAGCSPAEPASVWPDERTLSNFIVEVKKGFAWQEISVWPKTNKPIRGVRRTDLSDLNVASGRLRFASRNSIAIQKRLMIIRHKDCSAHFESDLIMHRVGKPVPNECEWKQDDSNRTGEAQNNRWPPSRP